MKYFDHLNVLSLIGIYLDLGDTPCIVMPFMDEGSLLSYLRRERINLTVSEIADKDIILDTRKKFLSMCLQIANGMLYLSTLCTEILQQEIACKRFYFIL